MASTRLIRFVEGVARGLSAAQAGRIAGYSEATLRNPRQLWSQPGARELYRAAQKRRGRAALLDPPAARAAKPVVTYFLRSEENGCVKIGKTSNLENRLHALRVASPATLTLVLVLAGDREAEMHHRFADCNIRGDWFRDEQRLREFLDEEQAKQNQAPPFPPVMK